MHSALFSKDLTTRIRATLIYFAQFHLKLHLVELQRLLFGTYADLSQIRNALLNMDDVFFEKDKILLKDFEYSGASDMAMIERIWKRVNQHKWMFKFLPFVKFAAVCNYIGLGVADKDSDIDVFLVAKKGRIFTVKFLSAMLMQFFGVRRHGRKVARRFCLSFYATENALDFSKVLLPHSDVYFAYWLMSLVPVYGSDEIWRSLRTENKWLGEFFTHFEVRRADYRKEKKYRDLIFKKLLEYVFSGSFGDWLESCLKKYFLKRYEKNKKHFAQNASIVINDEMLKYHLSDQRENIRQKFKSDLERFSVL